MYIQNRLAMIIPGTAASMVLVAILLFNVSAGFSYPTLAIAAAPQEIESAPEISNANQADLQVPSESRLGCKVSSNYPQSILQWCDWITHYSERARPAPGLDRGFDLAGKRWRSFSILKKRCSRLDASYAKGRIGSRIQLCQRTLLRIEANYR